MTLHRFDKWFWSMFEPIPAWPIFTLNQLYVNWEQIMSRYVVFGLDKKSVFPITRPTRPFFTDFERSYDVWWQNWSKISAKMDNFLIFEEKSHSLGTIKKYGPKKSRPTDSVFVGPCDRKHTLFLPYKVSNNFKKQFQKYNLLAKK